MIKLTFLPAVLAAAMTCAVGMPDAARAASVYGSAAILTNRNCAQAAGTACSGSRIFTQYAGGMSAGFATSASNMNGLGASAEGAVEFSDGYLPVLHAGSQAGPQTRTGGNITSFRSFTYTGGEAINLVLAGALDFNSSGSPLGNESAGEGYLGALLSIVPLSSLAQFTANSTSQDIVNSNVPFMDCSSGAIASTSYNSIGTGAGAHVATLGLSQTCQGSAITINPGDSFVIVATVQAISNRSGFADAMNTFKVQYDGAASTYVATGRSVGTAFLQSAIDGSVPEPASWSMLMLGFALTGTAMRRRHAAGARSLRLATPA